MSWHKLFNETKKEFNSIKLKPVSGQIPKEIKGTFFQNSSVMTKRAGEQHITWFDGDGAILRIHLENGEAEGSYKYIQTKAFQEEEKSGKFLYPSLGRLAPGFLNRLKRPINSANRANTSVFPLKDKLLVLFDMGKPHELDLDSLETKGLSDLNKSLAEKETSSAHLRIDPETKAIYNFGFDNSELNSILFYKFDSDFNFQIKNKIKLKAMPYMTHDFIFAGKYIVFFTFPLKFKALPFIFKKKPMMQCIEYDEKSFSNIFVLDKENLKLVNQFQVPANYFLHFVNGFEANNGNLMIDLIEFNNFDVFQRWTVDAVKGKLPDYEVSSKVVRYELDLKNNSVSNKSILLNLNHSCEWPLVKPHLIGKDYDLYYITTSIKKENLPNDLLKCNNKSGKMEVRNFGEAVYINEPTFIPNPNNPLMGWIIIVSYDSKKDTSYVHILNEDTMEDICKLELPSTIGNCSHGKWKKMN